MGLKLQQQNNCSKIITRKQEKYRVLKENTERLKNSAIPFMQRLPNEYNMQKEER